MNRRTALAFNALSKALSDADCFVRLGVRQKATEAALAAADAEVPVGTPLVCSDERHAAKVAALEAELAALHAGEEPYEDDRVVPSPGQWIWKWNRATPAERLTRASHVITDYTRLNRARQALAFYSGRPGLEQTMHAALGDGPGCPDPIECDHEAMVGQLAEDVRYLLSYTGPRHAHLQAGIWDDTGLPCAHCARLEEARQRLAALNGADIVPGGDVDAEPSP
jgi:hypothetical protein